jgi:hypothetical protein
MTSAGHQPLGRALVAGCSSVFGLRISAGGIANAPARLAARAAPIRAEPGESRDQPGPDRGAIRRAELVALGLPDADR